MDAATSDAIKAVLHSTIGASPVRPNTPVLPFGSTGAVATFVDPSVRDHIRQAHRDRRADVRRPLCDAERRARRATSRSATPRRSRMMPPPGQPEPPAGGRGRRHRRQRRHRHRRDGPGPGAGRRVRGDRGRGLRRAERPDRRRQRRPRRDRRRPGPRRPRRHHPRRGSASCPASTSRPRLRPATRPSAWSSPVVAADLATINQMLSNNAALAAGYTTLYQGNAATGASPGVNGTPGVNNGNLATVTGTSPEPGTRQRQVRAGQPVAEVPERLRPGDPGRLPHLPRPRHRPGDLQGAGQDHRPPLRPGEFDPGRRGAADHHRHDRPDSATTCRSTPRSAAPSPSATT